MCSHESRFPEGSAVPGFCRHLWWCLWPAFCLPWEILCWVRGGPATISLLGSQVSSGSMDSGHFNSAAEPNCVVVWHWEGCGALLHVYSSSRMEGCALILILLESLWVCRKKSALVCVLFSALDTCRCLRRALSALDLGKRPFLI